MTPKEFDNMWNTTITLYEESLKNMNPNLVIEHICEIASLVEVKKMFACYAHINKSDGRITASDRSYLKIPVQEAEFELPIWNTNLVFNSVRVENIERVHPAHIHNLIVCLKNKEQEVIQKYLSEKGLNINEQNEILHFYPNVYTIDDIKIHEIYENAWNLANLYVEALEYELDRHIKNVLNYNELGKDIAEDDEFMTLKSGRIIQFEV